MNKVHLVFNIVLGLFFLMKSILSYSHEEIFYNIYTEELDPISYREHSKVSGVATDIVKEVFKRANIKSKIMVFPWARSFQNVKNDKNGFVYPLVRSSNREFSFHWIGPIMIRKTSFWALNDRKDIIPVNNLQDLKQYKVGVTNKEYLHQTLVDRGFENNINIVPVSHSSINVEKLLAGRIDVMSGNNYTIKKKFLNLGYYNVSLKEIFTVSFGGYYIGANLDVPDETIERLKKSFISVRKSDFVEKMHVKYHLPYDKVLYKTNGFGH